MSKGGLGKSFGSLLPGDFDASILLDQKDRIQKVNLENVSPDPNQPRKQFDETKLTELASSVKRYGILQPLVVTPAETDGKYIIIAGERRFRAAKKAGLKSVPVLVRSSEQLERLEISLIENVQRVDLSPLEQALSIAKLNEQFNLSYSEVAKKLGKAESTIINSVRLLKLPEEAKKALNNEQISEGHARSILALNDYPTEQKVLLGSIIEKKWSVRQAEQFAGQIKDKKPKKPVATKVRGYNAEADQLAKKLETKVLIKPKKRGGQITIGFKTNEELEKILKAILN